MTYLVVDDVLDLLVLALLNLPVLVVDVEDELHVGEDGLRGLDHLDLLRDLGERHLDVVVQVRHRQLPVLARLLDDLVPDLAVDVHLLDLLLAHLQRLHVRRDHVVDVRDPAEQRVEGCAPDQRRVLQLEADRDKCGVLEVALQIVP